MTNFIQVHERLQVLSLDEYFGTVTVECTFCGHEFEIDSETDENMTMIGGDWFIECPECGQRGIPKRLN